MTPIHAGMDPPRQPDNWSLVIATELEALLRDLAIGVHPDLAPSNRICSALESFLPRVLQQRYREWEWESLDGIFVARATKTGPSSLEILGTGILLSDQTVTPFLVELQAVQSEESVFAEASRLSLGEPGGGRLGISGPPCGSTKAWRLLYSLADRIDDVHWSYTLGKGTS